MKNVLLFFGMVLLFCIVLFACVCFVAVSPFFFIFLIFKLFVRKKERELDKEIEAERGPALDHAIVGLSGSLQSTLKAIRKQWEKSGNIHGVTELREN